MYRASRFALSSSLASRLHYDGLLNCLQLSWKLVSQEHLNNYPFLHSATWQRYCWVHYQVNLLFLFLWREHEVLVALHSVTRSSSESFQFFPRDIGSPLGYLVRVVKELTHNDYYDLLTRIARAQGTPKGYLCREERILSFHWELLELPQGINLPYSLFWSILLGIDLLWVFSHNGEVTMSNCF